MQSTSRLLWATVASMLTRRLLRGVRHLSNVDLRSNCSGVGKQYRGVKRVESILTRSASLRRKSGIRAMVVLGFLICFLQCIALTGCSGRSIQAEAPVARSSSIADAPCGSRDDGLAHMPPRFNDFTPPAKGGGYIDPQYGCAI